MTRRYGPMEFLRDMHGFRWGQFFRELKAVPASTWWRELNDPFTWEEIKFWVWLPLHKLKELASMWTWWKP